MRSRSSGLQRFGSMQNTHVLMPYLRQRSTVLRSLASRRGASGERFVNDVSARSRHSTVSQSPLMPSWASLSRYGSG